MHKKSKKKFPPKVLELAKKMASKGKESAEEEAAEKYPKGFSRKAEESMENHKGKFGKPKKKGVPPQFLKGRK